MQVIQDLEVINLGIYKLQDIYKLYPYIFRSKSKYCVNYLIFNEKVFNYINVQRICQRAKTILKRSDLTFFIFISFIYFNMFSLLSSRAILSSKLKQLIDQEDIVNKKGMLSVTLSIYKYKNYIYMCIINTFY
jgi:hypothetical protein